MLLDEPLASLDLRHQRELLPYLQKLQRATEIPIIYVSHSLEEIARIADRLILIDNGKVIANGELNDVLTRFDLPLAHEHDAAAVLHTTVSGYDAEFNLSTLTFAGGELEVAVHRVAQLLQVDSM